MDADVGLTHTLILALKLIVAELVRIMAAARGTNASGALRTAPGDSASGRRTTHSAIPAGRAAPRLDGRDRCSPRLSPRELSLLDAIALRNKAIGAAWGISEATVGVHIKSILKRSGLLTGLSSHRLGRRARSAVAGQRQSTDRFVRRRRRKVIREPFGPGPQPRV
jgi:DNA-binding NarL/FixJ family response regulator